MIIGINGRFMIARKTGVQRVAYNLLKHIVMLDDKNLYVIFTGSEIDEPEFWNRNNVKVVVSNITMNTPVKNHLWEQVTLPKLAKEYKIDILHNPANIGPLFYKGKSVLNIHDLCFLVNPSWYSFAFRTLYKTIIPLLVSRATKVITNSNNSKNDIYLYLGSEPEKVSLTYWATESSFLEHSQYIDANFPYSDYILYVGSVEPRKNIRRLLAAYEQLRSEYPNLKTKLIIIGCSNPLFKGERFDVRRFSEDIFFQGYVSDERLINFYAHATCCIYPSLYEGFGLPPLEAMACGTPVITSNVSSLPEVVGDAAITIDPNDSNAIKNALYQLLTDDELRNAFIKKGHLRVQHFSWQNAASKTVQVYDEVFKSEN